jgi:hypothetical protein
VIPPDPHYTGEGGNFREGREYWGQRDQGWVGREGRRRGRKREGGRERGKEGKGK